MARGRRAGEEREEGGKGGKKRKKRKKGEGKKENRKRRKIEKRERERKKEERGAVRASGDRGSGRPRVACGPREVGHASEEEREEKGEGKKEGRDSRRPVTTRRIGWDAR